MSADTPPVAKRRQLDLREQVTVLLGPSKDAFFVPKAFLTKSSDFSKACCNGEWKESQTKTIELPETEADTFSIYDQWLCTGALVVCERDQEKLAIDPENVQERRAVVREFYGPLVSLAVFADTFGDVALSNAVTDLTL